MASELDLSLGALEVGVLLSSTLWGVTTVQLYMYLITPNKDPLWTKLLVHLVWIFESLHTIFAWVYIYRLTVTFYGVPAVIGEAHWSLSASSLFDGIIGAIVQMFFAYRVKLFSHSWLITAITWMGSLLQLSFTIAITILSPKYTVVEFAAQFGWLMQAVFCIDLGVDIINTAGLTYFFYRARTGFKTTDAIMEKLVMWTIETGLVTVIAAAVTVILLRAMSGTALWIGISLFYAKLYSNTFLAILNSRSSIRQGFVANKTHESSGFGSGPWKTTGTGVNVTVVQKQERDIEMGSVHQTKDKSRLDI